MVPPADRFYLEGHDDSTTLRCLQFCPRQGKFSLFHLRTTGTFDLDQRRRSSAMLNELLSAVPSWQQSMEFLAAHSAENAMITFNVVKEQHGWAIRMMDERMITPF
jgi:hypothetical protein